MNKQNTILGSILILIYMCAGCTSVNTFGTVARPGDTISIGLGWQQALTSNDVKVTITDSNNSQFTYLPGDPAIRAVINTYPDPISNLIVGAETGQPNIEGSLAGIATALIDASITGNDKDYMQTFMLLDLPTGMMPGMGTVSVTDPLDNPIPNPAVFNTNIDPINVMILNTGLGTPNNFATQESVVLVPGYLKAMERSPHYTISLQGTTIPYAVQLAFTHAPDLDNGGTGRAFVSNPRADLKSISWNDDGNNLNVIVLPARTQPLSDMKQFKFYVAGGILGLTPGPVAAFDINGVPVTGVTVSVN